MRHELDEMNKKIAEFEKSLIQNKATIDSSIENLKKLDDKIGDGEKKLEALEDEKKDLEEQVEGMESKAMEIFEKRKTAEMEKERFRTLLEEKKNDFNKMKRDMKDIDD